MRPSPVLTLSLFWSPALRIGGLSKAVSLWSGAHFHKYAEGSFPSPNQDQAAELFSGLQFVPMQKEGRG